MIIPAVYKPRHCHCCHHKYSHLHNDPHVWIAKFGFLGLQSSGCITCPPGPQHSETVDLANNFRTSTRSIGSDQKFKPSKTHARSMFWPKHFRIIAPKRNNLPDEDGVIRNYTLHMLSPILRFTCSTMNRVFASMSDGSSVVSALMKRGYVSFQGTRTLQIFGTRSSF